jgi:bifunctional non-homologous end joining protein LigD
VTLATYRKKRHFQKTPEPTGGKAAGGALRFVIQKHDASRLHYDFRLELDGTLKSWAVPKGPSLNPADKRLAMMVEDHPIDYRTFEGVIPAGNYGAGTVIVWDHGTYEAVGAADRKDGERTLRDGLAAGRISFILHGEKLQGEFTLTRLRRGAENAWLLIKKRDEFASDNDVTREGQSVITGRTLADVENGSKAKPKPKKPLAAKRRGKERMPHKIKPMLATLVDAPFERPGWLFEVKWDGYRAIAEVSRDGVQLYSRNHNPFETKFAPVVAGLEQLGHEAVLDGEVVVVEGKGRSQFQLLQNYQKTGKGDLVYVVFDLLYLDGKDLRSEPLVRRKGLLKKLFKKSIPRVRFGEHIEETGVAFFSAAMEQGLEGIIGKDGQSPYREGLRTSSWVKIKTRQRQEAVIGGFTSPRGSRVGLGALVLGVYDNDELIYIGHTGGGLDTRGLEDLTERLSELETKTCPFAKKPKTNAHVRWVEPTLVCEVEFQEWTEDGRMRQPVFLGLREDKKAKQVRREMSAQEPANAKATQKQGAKPQTKGSDPPLTNLDKIYWPDDGFTKGDLIAYYREIAPIILPYLRDRPMSLHRHPDGIDGESFFQKDVGRRPPPDWVRTVPISSESRAGKITYLVCDDEPTLLYLANLGCIELNPWNSRVGSLDKPDFLIIDLDPEAIPFSKVIAAAVQVRKVLEDAEAECLVKTSGKRGLHICVPLGAKYDYETARQFAEVVANVVHPLLPKTTSLERRPVNRQRRVYLDYLQNSRGQTLAAPYSLRPAPGAPVSTPLQWREVRQGLDPTKFNIRTMAKRIDKVGDLWKPILGKGVDLMACLGRLERR